MENEDKEDHQIKLSEKREKKLKLLNLKGHKNEEPNSSG